MANIEAGSYQRFTDETYEKAIVPGERFYVKLSGNTNGAHDYFVKMLKRVGHTEVISLERCDYVVMFCPIASRVGTDIGEAQKNMPAGKPAILVVMHHTFNPDVVIAESRRHVNNPNIPLTVDCVFHEDHFLLQSNHNDLAWSQVQKFLGVSVPQNFNQQERSTSQRFTNFIRECWMNPTKCVILILVFTLLVLLLITAIIVPLTVKKEKP